MSFETPVQHALVSSGQTVSGDIDLRGSGEIGILAPTIDSAQVFLQGNVDQTSGNFMRVWDVDGAAEFSWDVGPGSAALVVSDHLRPFRRMRIETSAAQTDNRSFAVVQRT